MSDEDDPADLDHPLLRSTQTAFTYADLERHAKRHAIRFLKPLTCANGAKPLGTGLWEGIALRSPLAGRPSEDTGHPARPADRRLGRSPARGGSSGRNLLHQRTIVVTS